jgi:hypothetical protein
MRPLWIKGMGGMGDNILQRPLVRFLTRSRSVWLSTPYPELYSDLPVTPVHWNTLDLRCQLKNMARQPEGTYQPPPVRPDTVRIMYSLREIRQSIVQEMERCARAIARPFVFDLPSFEPPTLPWPRYAVVRPATVRREWMNTARNPLPEYLAQAAAILREMMPVVVVADVDGKQEWMLDPAPKGDRAWLRGELDTPRLMGLVQNAAVVVGGVGWMVPAALAYRTPAVVIGGGLGGHNAPEVLVDRRMDASRMRFLLPDRYCRCRDTRHQCEKTISDLPTRFRAALGEILSSSAG